MSLNTKFIPLSRPYPYKIKNITFIVSSFGNQNTSVCAEDMLCLNIKFHMKTKKVM